MTDNLETKIKDKCVRISKILKEDGSSLVGVIFNKHQVGNECLMVNGYLEIGDNDAPLTNIIGSIMKDSLEMLGGDDFSPRSHEDCLNVIATACLKNPFIMIAVDNALASLKKERPEMYEQAKFINHLKDGVDELFDAISQPREKSETAH